MQLKDDTEMLLQPTAAFFVQQSSGCDADFTLSNCTNTARKMAHKQQYDLTDQLLD